MGVALSTASYLGDNTVAILGQLAAHIREVGDVDIRFDDVAPRTSPDAVNDAVGAGPELIWACGLLTVELIDSGKLDAEIIAAPIFPGETEPVYHSVIVSHPESRFASLSDATGAKLAINEPESWSGHHGLVAHMSSEGLSIDMFDVVETGSHANSVSAVVAGKADLAAIDHTIWEQAVIAEPGAAGLTVIGRTTDWPAPPFSISRTVDPEVRARLRTAVVSVGPGDVSGLTRIVPASRRDYNVMSP